MSRCFFCYLEVSRVPIKPKPKLYYSYKSYGYLPLGYLYKGS